MPHNPFKIPKISSIFELRDAEISARKQERQNARKLKVFQKIPLSKRCTPRRKLLEDEKSCHDKEASDQHTNELLKKTRERYTEGDTHQQYISRLREMFFLEYSIAIQKEEIVRLEELAKREEEKLDLAEQCLEQDAALFDEFLKDSDKTSVEAVALAEKEARKRSDLGDEIKRLNAVQMKITAEITRLKEQVRECKSFGDFLEQLVPEPHRSKRREMWEETLRAKREARQKARSALASRSSATTLTDFSEPPARRPSFVLRRRSSLKPTGRNVPKTLPSPPLKKLQEDLETSSDDDVDLEVFFSSPEEFLTVIYDLEEANLRLLRNYQETQENIDLLKNIAEETRQRIETDNSVLIKQNRSLQAEVQQEIEKVRDLTTGDGVSAFAGMEKGEQEELLKSLHEQISQVYERCLRKTDAPLSSIQLLTDIEEKMIDLMQELQKLPDEDVKNALRTREKAHRLEAKEQRKREQREHQEERIRKAIERARAEPKKRTGRPVMSRSEPPKKEEKYVKDDAALAEERKEMAFLFG